MYQDADGAPRAEINMPRLILPVTKGLEPFQLLQNVPQVYHWAFFSICNAGPPVYNMPYLYGGKMKDLGKRREEPACECLWDGVVAPTSATSVSYTYDGDARAKRDGEAGQTPYFLISRSGEDEPEL